MKWVLIIWLGTPSNYTVYQTFNTMNECANKQEMVYKALRQADSKMQLTCREERAQDRFNNSDIVINKYVVR